MCLVAVARHAHPRWPLVLLANRDEFHARPSAPAHWWEDLPGVLGGRDLAAGGSWLAVSRAGRFAVITNQPARRTGRRPDLSRGSLVRNFVAAASPPMEWLERLAAAAADYAGFCLVAGDTAGVLALASPGPASPLPLGPGVFAISNAPLEERWPKVEQLREELTRRLAHGGELSAEALLAMIGPPAPPGATSAVGAGSAVGAASAANSRAEDSRLKPLPQQKPLPENKLAPADLARLPHLPFIVGADYGTRCSTLFRVAGDGWCEFIERRFDPAARITGESRHEFRLEKFPPAP